MSTYHLSIAGSYQKLTIALFKNETCKEFISSTGKSSAELIPLIDQLLKKHSLQISDLSFLAVDQGPGAFTSLRVIIATINGIGFASSKPLIGIDGIDALHAEAREKIDTNLCDGLVVLLNAFNFDLYFGIYNYRNKQYSLIEPHNYAHYETLFAKLDSLFAHKTLAFIGNGISLHEEHLHSYSFKPLLFRDIEQASAHFVGLCAYKKWENKEFVKEIKPLYLKTQQFNPKYSVNQSKH